MAIAVTDRGTTNATPTTATSLSIASASFTPAAGSVLVALINNRVPTGPWTPTVTDTFGDSGGTAWAERVENHVDGAEWTSIHTRLVGSGAGSGAITGATGDVGTNTSRAIIMSIGEVTGATSAVPVQTQNGYSATNAVTITFGSVPAATSAVLAINYDKNGVSNPTAPGGFTVLFQGSYDPNDVTWTGYDVGSAAQGMTWTGSGSTGSMTACAVELTASAGQVTTYLAQAARIVSPR